MLALIAVSLLSGCTTEHHRWQTVVNEDGSVVRTISRPSVGSSIPSEESEDWETSRYHKEISRDVWPERITEERISSALPEYEKELNYIIQEGTYESLDKVPQHYRFELAGTELVSELQHQLTINDYGLVKEYLWSEEVTDVVTYEDIPVARREMIQLFATVVREGLLHGLGDEYDVSELIRWIENEGDQLVEEFTLVVLSKEFRDLEEEERQKRFDAVAARYGITDLSDEGLLLYARKRLSAGVKRRDGKPLEQELIDALLDDPLNQENANPQPNKYQAAIKAAWKKHVWVDEDKPNKLQILLARQVGLHAVPLLKGPHEFDVWLKLPGEVIETNGVVDEEGFLKWSFEDEDISPTGYQMTARSVLPVRVRNSQVLRKEKLGLRDEMLKFLRLVKSDEKLHETVQECLKQNSLQSLKDLEKLRRDEAGNPQIGQQLTTEEQAKWSRARQLLDLLNQDPPATAN